MHNTTLTCDLVNLLVDFDRYLFKSKQIATFTEVHLRVNLNHTIIIGMLRIYMHLVSHHIEKSSDIQQGIILIAYRAQHNFYISRKLMSCTFHKCKVKMNPSCPTSQYQLLKLTPVRKFDKV